MWKLIFGGFIGSHLCEKLMAKMPHKVLALDVYNDKIKHLLEPASAHPWFDRIQFHRLNIKNDSHLRGLIKMSDLFSSTPLSTHYHFKVSQFLRSFFETILEFLLYSINLAAICTLADYNTHPLDMIYSNFINALPVVSIDWEQNRVFFNSCCIWNILEFDLIDWNFYLFYVRFTKIWLLFDWRWCVWLWFLNLIRLSITQRTISISFTSLLVRCTGKRLGAFFLKIVLFVR